MKIVTDSTADLPQDIIADLGITVVPLKVIFGEEVFRDGIDISGPEFYARMKETTILPRTSQPTPAEFVEVFRELGRDGSTIISIHISSRMSGTFQSACLAKNELPDLDIVVLDSGRVSMVLGLLVLNCARAAKAGASKEEILNYYQRIQENLVVYFIPATLEYLEKGGRIGKAAAVLGSLLNIKPICTLEDGIIVAKEKIRTINKGFDRIIELFQEKFGTVPLQVIVASAGDKELLSRWEEKVKAGLNCGELIATEIGPIVGTHGGPGVSGVVACPQAILKY